MWNLAAALLQLVAPLAWTSPFGAAYLAAAGYGGLSILQVAPGAVLGAVLGRGGFGAAAGGILAFTAAELLRSRADANARGAAALTALVFCLVPCLSFHIAGGAYDVISGILCAVAAMAACPVFCGFVNDASAGRMTLNEEESVSFLLLVCLCLAGSIRLFAPLGFFLTGLFALALSFGGVFSALAGALAGSAALLFGDAGGSEIAVLLLSASFSGVMCVRGAFLQSAAFLMGIPLFIYFGAERQSLFLFASAAVYPWIPRAYRAHALRYLGFFRDKPKRYLFATSARRHLPAPGKRAVGDTGFTEALKNGRMLFMLADGMGTGDAARRASSRALSYAREMFAAAITPLEAMKCINALCLEEKSEMHTTLDVCLLDLVTGRAHFVKSGAEPAWILGKRGITRVEGEALPLGVLSDAPGDMKSVMLEPEDLVFMATDGLICALGGTERTQKALAGLRFFPASAVCAGMIKKARAASRGRWKDDMSCLCIRVHAVPGFRAEQKFLPAAKPQQNRRAG